MEEIIEFFELRDAYRRGCFGREFVQPHRNRGPEDYPYSYDPFYLWRTDAMEGAGTEYSDRLAERNREAYDRAVKAVGKRMHDYRKADAEAFLSEYLGEPVVAVAMAEGCNQSTGYPYWLFWFVSTAESN